MADDRIKVGFVGCGGITRLYTDIYAGLADIASVVAVADPVDGQAEKRRRALIEAYKAEAHLARVRAEDARSDAERESQLARAESSESAADVTIRKYRTHEDLLKDDEVQAIVVSTPPTVRSGPTIAAAEAGRHVFTQGPMARSVEEADAMVAAVRKAGIKFLSQCGSRYSRGMALAQRAVASGKLGEIGSARVEMSEFRSQGYYEFGRSTGLGSTQQRTWMGTWEGEGGGAIFHQGRYIVDPFLWVIGSRVVEVFAYSWPALRRIEHESLTQAVVRFDNGATGIIHASRITHDQERTPHGRIEVLGHDASLLVENRSYQVGATGRGRESYWQADTTFGSNDTPAAVEALEALEVTDMPQGTSEEHQSRLFLESIINDTETPVPIEVPHHHVEVVRAVYKSAAEHQPVTLPLDKDDPFYSFEGRVVQR